MCPAPTLVSQPRDCDSRPRSPKRPDVRTWPKTCDAALNLSRFQTMCCWMSMNFCVRDVPRVLINYGLLPIGFVMSMEPRKQLHFSSRQLWCTSGEVFFSDVIEYCRFSSQA